MSQGAATSFVSVSLFVPGLPFHGLPCTSIEIQAPPVLQPSDIVLIYNRLLELLLNMNMNMKKSDPNTMALIFMSYYKNVLQFLLISDHGRI